MIRKVRESSPHLPRGLCYDGTVFHLHGVKHGFPETSTSYDGVVGGKL